MSQVSSISLLFVLFHDVKGEVDLSHLFSIAPSDATLLVVGDEQNQPAVDGCLYWERSGRGRGELLREVFDFAASQGFETILTMDAHDICYVPGIPRLLHRAQEVPKAIVIATRPRTGNYVTKIISYFWRYVHNIWVRIYTGKTVPDVESTFRLYPLSAVVPLELKARGFEVEQEVLFKASWNGTELADTIVDDVDVITSSERRSVLHFLRYSWLLFKAFFHRFVSPFSGAPVPGNGFREKLRNLIMHELKSNTSAQKAAFSVAMGVYFGLLPIHGFQIVSLMFVSTRWKLNRPLAFLGVNVSMPPLLPLVFYGALSMGSLLTGSGLSVSLDDADLLRKGMVYGVDFFIGSLVLAHGAALLVYILLVPLFSAMKRKG